MSPLGVMKASILAAFTFTTVAAAAIPPLDFPTTSIPLPSPSILDRATDLVDAVKPLDAGAHGFRARVRKEPPKHYSRMPIQKPRTVIDSKMVHAPKPGVDYKLIIKDPGVELRR